MYLNSSIYYNLCKKNIGFLDEIYDKNKLVC